MNNPFGSSPSHHDGWAVASAPETTRSEFIHKTYQHLAAAIAAFVGLEALLLQLPVGGLMQSLMSSQFAWLAVLGVFMVVSTVARRWADSDTSVGMQYMGLGLYVVAWSLLTLPMLYVAMHFMGPTVIAKAGIVTGAVFAGLTATVLLTKTDFSFMRGALSVAGFGALGMIVASILFGFSLGTWFSGLMIIVAAGYIVYDTSNILHHYRPGQHVAASLALFSSVGLLFWYVLRFFMGSRD